MARAHVLVVHAGGSIPGPDLDRKFDLDPLWRARPAWGTQRGSAAMDEPAGEGGDAGGAGPIGAGEHATVPVT